MSRFLVAVCVVLLSGCSEQTQPAPFWMHALLAFEESKKKEYPESAAFYNLPSEPSISAAVLHRYLTKCMSSRCAVGIAHDDINHMIETFQLACKFPYGLDREPQNADLYIYVPADRYSEWSNSLSANVAACVQFEVVGVIPRPIRITRSRE